MVTSCVPEESNVRLFPVSRASMLFQGLQDRAWNLEVESRKFLDEDRKGDSLLSPFLRNGRPICRFLCAQYRSSRSADRCSLPLSQLPVLPTEIAIMEWVMIRDERLQRAPSFSIFSDTNRINLKGDFDSNSKVLFRTSGGYLQCRVI